MWPGKLTPPILSHTNAFSSRYDLAILHHLAQGAIGPALVSPSPPAISLMRRLDLSRTSPKASVHHRPLHSTQTSNHFHTTH